jgi:hypothetical protein
VKDTHAQLSVPSAGDWLLVPRMHTHLGLDVDEVLLGI